MAYVRTCVCVCVRASMHECNFKYKQHFNLILYRCAHMCTFDLAKSVRMYLCMYVCMYVCTVCMYACMYASMQARVCVCVWVCLCLCECMHACMNVCMYVRACVCVRAYACTL